MLPWRGRASYTRHGPEYGWLGGGISTASWFIRSQTRQQIRGGVRSVVLAPRWCEPLVISTGVAVSLCVRFHGAAGFRFFGRTTPMASACPLQQETAGQGVRLTTIPISLGVERHHGMAEACAGAEVCSLSAPSHVRHTCGDPTAAARAAAAAARKAAAAARKAAAAAARAYLILKTLNYLSISQKRLQELIYAPQ